jgi:hypothetical protein
MRARAAVLLGVVVATLLGVSGYAAATLTDNKGFSFSMLSKATIPDGVNIRPSPPHDYPAGNAPSTDRLSGVNFPGVTDRA